MRDKIIYESRWVCSKFHVCKTLPCLIRVITCFSTLAVYACTPVGIRLQTAYKLHFPPTPFLFYYLFYLCFEYICKILKHIESKASIA